MIERIEAELGLVITDLYDAVLDPSKWHPLAYRFAAAFGRGSCVLMTHERDGSGASLVSVTENIQAHLAEYVSHYYKFDEWAKRAAARDLGEVVIGEELASQRELSRSEIFDLMSKTGNFQMLGAALPATSRQTAFIGIHGERDAPGFTVEQTRQLKMLLPHIQRALQMKEQLGIVTAQRNAALDALARMSTAAIIVDAAGRIVIANALAIALLRTGDGVAEIGGKLTATSPGPASKLAHLIQQAVNIGRGRGMSAAGDVVGLPRRDGGNLTVLVGPLCEAHPTLGGTKAGAIVLIRDPQQRVPATPKFLRDLFGLSAAEAMLVLALTEGHSLEQISEQRQTSLNTLRTQLKSAMGKVGANRQGELIAIVLRSVAAMREK